MAAKKKSNVTYIGTGRRKTAVARVFMTPGTGAMSINGKTLEEYLPEETLRMVVRSPLELTETLGQFDIKINVCLRRGAERPFDQHQRRPAESPRSWPDGDRPDRQCRERHEGALRSVSELGHGD